MKKISTLLAIILLSTNSVYAKSNASATVDPFIKSWLYNDGAATYTLSVTTSDAPGGTYSVSYKSPTEEYSSDFCSATSATTLQCYGGVNLTRDDSQHFVTVNSADTHLNYYDPAFMPPMSPVYGTWKYSYVDPYDQSTNTATVVVKSGDNANEVKIDTAFTSSNGNNCQYPGDQDYLLTTNSDGTQRYVNTYESTFGFVYNPKTNTITKLPEQDNFTFDDCVGFGAKVSAEAIFKK